MITIYKFHGNNITMNLGKKTIRKTFEIYFFFEGHLSGTGSMPPG